MRVRDGDVCEVREAVHFAERHEHTLQRHQRVRHGAEHDETQRRTVAQRRESLVERQVLVHTDRDHRNDHQPTRDNRRRDHPGRQRTADQMVHSVQTVEESERPEAEQRQLVAVDRSSENFRNEVVRRSKADRREPETERVVRVKPVHRRALDARIRWPVANHEDDRKPDERGHDVPHADIQMLDFAHDNRRQQAQSHQTATDHNKRVGPVARHLKPLEAIAVSGQNADDAQHHADVPEIQTGFGGLRHAQLGVYQPRNDPHADAEHRTARPTVRHRVQMGGANAPECQCRVAHQPIGGMQFDAGNKAKYRTNQQPDHGECKRADRDLPARRISTQSDVEIFHVGDRRCPVEHLRRQRRAHSVPPQTPGVAAACVGPNSSTRSARCAAVSHGRVTLKSSSSIGSSAWLLMRSKWPSRHAQTNAATVSRPRIVIARVTVSDDGSMSFLKSAGALDALQQNAQAPESGSRALLLHSATGTWVKYLRSDISCNTADRKTLRELRDKQKIVRRATVVNQARCRSDSNATEALRVGSQLSRRPDATTNGVNWPRNPSGPTATRIAANHCSTIPRITNISLQKHTPVRAPACA